ncbi:MAG: hypothetical protein DI598_08190 [Pseudopedobacter saltans]|uniref:Uncharacterized protein n=1 Tax=Pseudopedobacter saltans TaxID=151895 RepID=A0A2W5F634_9SPHI|nr:MAG: hypothetical protein DI598_08190 [Pseudopedobacter saltans]
MKQPFFVAAAILFFSSIAKLGYAQEKLKEGHLQYAISIEDKVLKKYMDNIKQGKGKPMEAMKNAANGMSPAEIDYLKKITKDNPEMGLSLILLPYLGNSINLKGEKTLGECKAITYELQNLWDQTENKGVNYIESTVDPSNNLSFTYDKSYKVDDPMTIGANNFDKVETSEHVKVLDFDTHKTVYKRKSSTSHKVPYKLEVYTTPFISNAVNFSHPYYSDEKDGIVKINAYLTEGAAPMVYQLVKYDKNKVTAAELTPKTSTKQYSTKTETDKVTLGFNVLGIMLNTGGEGSSGTKEDDDNED